MENMRYKEAFLLMDQTNAGVISVNDVHLLIRALGFTPTQADLDGIDRDLLNGGDVDYLWFVDVISRMSCTQYTYEQVKNAFYAFDKNRYGSQFLALLGTFYLTIDRCRSDQCRKFQGDDDRHGRAAVGCGNE